MQRLSNSFLRYFFLSFFALFCGCASGGEIFRKIGLTEPTRPNEFEVFSRAWDNQKDHLICNLPASRGQRSHENIIAIVSLQNASTTPEKSKAGSPLKLLSISESGSLLGWCGEGLEPRLLGNLDTHTSSGVGEGKFDGFAVSLSRSFVAAKRGKDIYIFSIASAIESNIGESKFKLLGVRKLEVSPLDISFEADGDSLLIAGSDGAVYRWKFFEKDGLTKDGALFEKYIGPSAAISVVKVSPLGRMFFTGDWDGAINGWLLNDADRQTGEYDKNYFTGQFVADSSIRVKFDRGGIISPAENLVLSGDGAKLVAAFRDGTIEYWNIRGPRRLASQTVHSSSITAMAISEDSKLVATAGRDAKVNVIDLSACDSVEPWQSCALSIKRTIDQAGVKALAIIGTKVFVSSHGEGIRVVDLTKPDVPSNTEEFIQ